MHEAKAEITRIFAEPFPASGAPGASGPSESQLQLEYSASTAEWLRRVAEAPHDFALVYNFVSNLLSDSDQPLGALTRRFATLFDSLFLPAHQSSLRKSFSAEALTEKLAGPAASRSRHKSTIASAASSMHLGVNRLHRRCIDVLPPLQCAAASLAAMEAVQAALFELCGPTLHALVGLIVSTEDVALQARPRSNASPRRASSPDLRPLPHQARLSQLSHLHPHHFGLPELFWLGQPPPQQQRTGAALAVESLDRAYPVGAKAEEPQPLEHASPHLVLACPVEPGNTVEAGAEDASTEGPGSGEASTEASMLVLARPVEEACFKPPVAATSPPPSVPLWQRLGGGAPVTAPPVAPPAFVPPRTDEPYSAAIAYVQALPRFASPRQKLRLLADACTEAARCVERHHRSTASTMPAAVPGRPPPYPLPVDDPPRTPPRSPPRTPGSRTPTRMRSGDGLRRLPSWHVGLSAAEGGDLPLRRLPSLHIPVEVAAAAAADWEVAAARAVEEEMAEMAARQEAMEAEAAGEAGEAEEAEEELEGEETTFDQAATMAADDLIPVMSYVLARARMPQVLSEVRFVEAFARGAGEEGLLLGRLGYGLATFQAALQLLGSAELDPAAIAAMEPGAASEAAARADARARGRSCGLQLEPAAALADMRHSIACGGKRRPSGGAAEWERSLLAHLVFRRRCARTQTQRTPAPPSRRLLHSRRRSNVRRPPPPRLPLTPLHATGCRPRTAAALVCCRALLCAAMRAQGD